MSVTGRTAFHRHKCQQTVKRDRSRRKKKYAKQYFNGHFSLSQSHFSSIHDGMLADNPHLVLLFYLSQLFLRELFKSYRLIQVVPMDMSGYYGKCVCAVWKEVVFRKINLCLQHKPMADDDEIANALAIINWSDRFSLPSSSFFSFFI